MSDSVRVRFAPSPTGNVHIGNIRVAIFNWLYARAQKGKFLLRIEDTDLERSTGEAIANLLEAMDWLGLDYDDEPVYQTSQVSRHTNEADRLLNLEYAYRNSDATPAMVLKICKELFDPSFVTEPREEVEVDYSKAFAVRGTLRSLVNVTVNKKGDQQYITPMPWDAIEDGLQFVLEDGSVVDGAEVFEKVREACGPNLSDEESCDVCELAGGKIVTVKFRRRYVFFDDLILGRCEKPLDSLRDQVIVRGDGSPVFHLANVIDDATMNITHVLRGNDHVENTFRHLFLFKAIGADAPKYGHFPMIVNVQGKPYSKRDGDAYIGDFRDKGFLPAALFNFLALCGWNPGDEREKMSVEEMIGAFSLDRVSKSPAQLNIEKLEWLNGRYLTEMPREDLLPLIKAELESAGLLEAAKRNGDDWLLRLVELQKERIRTVKEFVEKSAFFFGGAATVDFSQKNIRKVFKKETARTVLAGMLPVFTELPSWSEDELKKAVDDFVEARELKMGDVAQPLRIAVTGGTVSPGIHETMFLIGRATCLKRLEDTLALAPVPE